MDYFKIYNSIISKAKTRQPDPHQYYEKHHIKPKCLGGSNSKDNIVRLTAKEHFVCHHLLFKIYGGSKLANAWYSMCRVGVGQEKRLMNARLFHKAKIARSKLLSVNSRGKLNNFYGKKHSQETKLKISKANKNRKKSKNEIENWVKKVSSKPKNDSHKKKIGRKNLTMIQNIHTGEIKRIPIDLIGSLYDSKEWVNPRLLKPEQKHKCNYCEVVTTNANLKRWHNENCKHYPYRTP